MIIANNETQEVEETKQCKACKHYDGNKSFSDIGQCRCSSSKFYMDIVDRANTCEQISLKNT